MMPPEAGVSPHSVAMEPLIRKCRVVGCRFVADTMRGLSNHYTHAHRPGSTFACALCGSNFSSAFELDTHEAEHESINRGEYHCCLRVFQSREALANHKRSDHEDPDHPRQKRACTRDAEREEGDEVGEEGEKVEGSLGRDGFLYLPAAAEDRTASLASRLFLTTFASVAASMEPELVSGGITEQWKVPVHGGADEISANIKEALDYCMERVRPHLPARGQGLSASFGAFMRTGPTERGQIPHCDDLSSSSHLVIVHLSDNHIGTKVWRHGKYDPVNPHASFHEDREVLERVYGQAVSMRLRDLDDDMDAVTSATHKMDIFLFRPDLLHAGPPNLSSTARICFFFVIEKDGASFRLNNDEQFNVLDLALRIHSPFSSLFLSRLVECESAGFITAWGGNLNKVFDAVKKKYDKELTKMKASLRAEMAEKSEAQIAEEAQKQLNYRLLFTDKQVASIPPHYMMN
jgi:hypothetical protein